MTHPCLLSFLVSLYSLPPSFLSLIIYILSRSTSRLFLLRCPFPFRLFQIYDKVCEFPPCLYNPKTTYKIITIFVAVYCITLIIMILTLILYNCRTSLHCKFKRVVLHNTCVNRVITFYMQICLY